MATGKFKPIFERSLNEQSVLLKSRIENVQHENLSRGLYNTYRDSECITNDLLIREYPDRKELVRVNSKTGLTQTIKTVL
jgi:hypothetical protein